MKLVDRMIAANKAQMLVLLDKVNKTESLATLEKELNAIRDQAIKSEAETRYEFLSELVKLTKEEYVELYSQVSKASSEQFGVLLKAMMKKLMETELQSLSLAAGVTDEKEAN